MAEGTLATATEPTPDQLEQELIHLESLVARIRARQVSLLRLADAMQLPHADGTRSLKEWTTGRLDLHPGTATDLAYLARSQPGRAEDRLAAGTTSFDRAAATTRLRNSGADEATLDRSEGVAVHHVTRMTARQRRFTAWSEDEAVDRRRIWLQPNLSNTLMTGTLTLAGPDAELLLAVLDERADEMCAAADINRPGLGQRRADALVSLAVDQQSGGNGSTTPRRPTAHIFIDAAMAARTDGEAGAMTGRGVKVGRRMLEEILCIGTNRVTLVDVDGLTPIPATGDTLHPRIRDFVMMRDGGCTADGCTSTYRLEPHHIRERSRGGSHRLVNLACLCWFHHHVVIHRLGYRIDPRSQPGRLRFVPPASRGRPPPDR